MNHMQLRGARALTIVTMLSLTTVSATAYEVDANAATRYETQPIASPEGIDQPAATTQQQPMPLVARGCLAGMAGIVLLSARRRWKEGQPSS